LVYYSSHICHNSLHHIVLAFAVVPHPSPRRFAALMILSLVPDSVITVSRTPPHGDSMIVTNGTAHVAKKVEDSFDQRPRPSCDCV